MGTRIFCVQLVLSFTLSTLLYSVLCEEPAATDKVHVELYAESLCPYCARFTKQILSPMFSNGLSDIVDLEIIMYGNAHDGAQVGFEVSEATDGIR